MGSASDADVWIHVTFTNTDAEYSKVEIKEITDINRLYPYNENLEFLLDPRVFDTYDVKVQLAL